MDRSATGFLQRNDLATLHSVRILVTGASGKVGRAFVRSFLADADHSGWVIRALCHHRKLEASPRLEIVTGSIEDRQTVAAAMRDVTHVLHLATCKETPEQIMDVAVKGFFWILEEARISPSFRQLILIGGDAGIGHFFFPHPLPVTETQRHTAYPGCYALSKVLEEVMLEQYYVQYGLHGCCLRAPWIMEKDDFKFTLSFGNDVFGGPRWRDLVGSESADRYEASNTVPVLCDGTGTPIQRNFVHVEDLLLAITTALNHPKAAQQTFNICMDDPVDYGFVARHLLATRGYPSVKITTEYHSTWLDNAKAKFLLGWRPAYDSARLVDSAFDYVRGPDEPRVVWYPG